MKSFAYFLSVFVLGSAATTTTLSSTEGKVSSSDATTTTKRTAYDPALDAVWSTFTPASPLPTDALTDATNITFGIAIMDITNDTVLQSLSSMESMTATMTSSSQSENASSSSASGTSSSASATATMDIDSYFKFTTPKSDTALMMTLNSTVLFDSHGRVGSIVANRQFQFDGPPQAGAIYAAGWGITTDGYLTIGDNDIFFQCLSGTFYNLYDESLGSHCTAVNLAVVEFV